MAAVTLTENDIALFVDVVNTRIPIPRLTGKATARSGASSLVHFDGFDFPHEYRTRARTDTIDYQATFTESEHPALVDLIALWERSRTLPDARFQIRTRIGTTPGVNPLEVVSIPAMSAPHEMAGLVVVSWTATRVHYSLAV